MSGGSLGIRSGSYGSLDKQLQNGVLPIQVPSATKTKPFKTFKEKETFLHWICKFAGRKKVGLLLLCAISAAIFVWVLYLGKGAFDNMLQPKNISKYSEQTVCLYMFVDEETKSDLETEHGLNESKKIGLWRIVVVHNLPYANGRRNGKIPKFLLHRLFPMLVSLCGLMGSSSFLLIRIKFLRGSCGEKMLLLQFLGIIYVLMCLRKLRQIKLLANTTMPPLTFRCSRRMCNNKGACSY